MAAASAFLGVGVAILVVVQLAVEVPAAWAHNITHILAGHDEFSTFNEYLTKTHLAEDINRRKTITVCALDNAAMSDIISKGYPLYTIRNILTFHVIVDYYGAKKLHQIPDGTTLSATMFQATGDAAGDSGYVNITDLGGGKVGVMPAEQSGTSTKFNSFFVKSVFEKPYSLSVIQLSQPLSSAEAAAPTPEPSSLNLTSILSSKGCKSFADLLQSSGAISTYQDNLESGLTVVCVGDGAVKSFMPKYNNLTAGNKTAIMLYHGVPLYSNLDVLRNSNGKMNTLATNGDNHYDLTVQNDGDDVTLKTKVVTAKITGTLVDKDPLAVFKLDKVLLPPELFKADPKYKEKEKKKQADAPSPDSASSDEDLAPGPGSADDATADDDTTNKNGSPGTGTGRNVQAALFLFVWVSVALL